MAVIGDIIELVMNSQYLSAANRQMQVWQHEITELNDPSFPLALGAQSLGEQMFLALYSDILDITNQAITYTDGTFKNLSDPTEIGAFSLSPAVPGTNSGDCLPPYVTYSFLLQRLNATTRNGHKRFAGVGENQQINGDPVSGAITTLDDVADVIGNPLVLAGVAPDTWEMTLSPRIVRKDATGALVLSQPVLSARFTSIGTQNTRKFGRGM